MRIQFLVRAPIHFKFVSHIAAQLLIVCVQTAFFCSLETHPKKIIILFEVSFFNINNDTLLNLFVRSPEPACYSTTSIRQLHRNWFSFRKNTADFEETKFPFEKHYDSGSFVVQKTKLYPDNTQA